MIRRTTVFTFKITAVSLAIYFAPVGHIILSLFGIRTHNGKAYAGTITCSAGGEVDTMNCTGQSGIYSYGDYVQCQCSTDSSKVRDYYCGVTLADKLEDRDKSYWYAPGSCYTKNACSPNGSTKDCSTAAQYCTQTCINGSWGPAVIGNCKPGYIKVNGTCFAECSISNGKGYEVEENSSSSSSEA